MTTELKRMQQRSDTAADWAAEDPVLLKAEIGYDEDADRFKIGDGTTPWSGLDFYADQTALTGVQATVTASGVLVVSSHNPVNATSGAKTMTLDDASKAGLIVAVSKEDESGNAVTVSVGKYRGTSAGTVVLRSQYDAVLLQSKSDGSWWPVAQTGAGDGTIRAAAHIDGTTDAAAYLTGLATAAAAFGGWVRLLEGATYRCDSILALPTGTKIRGYGATVLRNLSGASTTANSLVTNAGGVTTKANNVRIHGGTWNAVDATKTGNIFGWYGDDWEIQDTITTLWKGGRLAQVSGDRYRLINMRGVITGGTTGDGGIRIMSGKHGVTYGCHVECGDDTYQFVPLGNPSGFPNGYNVDIEDCVFEACTGLSTAARFMAVGLWRTAGSTEMTTNIRRVRYIGCVGRGGPADGWHVQNKNSTGEINGVKFLGCSVQAATAQGTKSDGEISRTDASAVTLGGVVGRVRNITVEGWSAGTTKRQGIRVIGGVEDLVLRNFDFSAPYYLAVASMTGVSGNSYVDFAAALPDDAVGAAVFRTSGGGIPTANTVIGSLSAGNTRANLVDPTDGSAKTLTASFTAVTGFIGEKQTVSIDGAVRPRFENCRFGSTGLASILTLGNATVPAALPSGEVLSNLVTDARIKACHFDGVGDGFFGIDCVKVTGLTIEDCTFAVAGGSTTAGGLNVSSASSKIKVKGGNDFSPLPSATRVVTAATGLVTVATNNDGLDTWSKQKSILAADLALTQSSTTLQDSALVLTLEPYGTYEVAGTLLGDGDSAADFDVKPTTSGVGASGTWNLDGNSITGTNTIIRSSAALNVILIWGGQGVGTVVAAKPGMLITTGANRVTLTMQFAQHVSTALQNTVRAGSRLTAERVA